MRAAARLIGAGAAAAVLARADGATVSVPYQSLSDADLKFVRRQIVARRVELAAKAGSDLVAAQSR